MDGRTAPKHTTFVTVLRAVLHTAETLARLMDSSDAPTDAPGTATDDAADENEGWRIISVPRFSEARAHTAAVKAIGLVQQGVIPLLRRWELGGFSKARYAAGLAQITQRATDAMPLTAGCRCGAVKVEVSGGARHIFTCHCSTCADQMETAGRKAPTWTAVPRQTCRFRGPLRIWFSSNIGRRGNCARCNDCLFMDYSAAHTLYLHGALPTPANVEPDSTGGVCGECTADCDIFWKSRVEGASQTAARVFDSMPLGEMGFVPDPGRPLEGLRGLKE